MSFQASPSDATRSFLQSLGVPSVELTAGAETKSSGSAGIEPGIAVSTAALTSGPAGERASRPVAPLVLPRRRGRPPKKRTPALEDSLAGMLAAGVSPAQAAAVEKLSSKTVERWARSPEMLEKIQAIRDTLREINLNGLHRHTAAAYDMLGEMVNSRDAKGFQLTANGLANLERTASSAAGDARRVEQTVNGQLDANVTAEAQVLLQALFGVKSLDDRG